jgi:hypothetical protein
MVFKVSGVLLIEAADNPRPVHKLCRQTQHPKQDHRLESPRARPEPLPALSFGASMPRMPGVTDFSRFNIMGVVLSIRTTRTARIWDSGRERQTADLAL